MTLHYVVHCFVVDSKFGKVDWRAKYNQRVAGATGGNVMNVANVTVDADCAKACAETAACANFQYDSSSGCNLIIGDNASLDSLDESVSDVTVGSLGGECSLRKPTSITITFKQHWYKQYKFNGTGDNLLNLLTTEDHSKWAIFQDGIIRTDLQIATDKPIDPGMIWIKTVLIISARISAGKARQRRDASDLSTLIARLQEIAALEASKETTLEGVTLSKTESAEPEIAMVDVSGKESGSCDANGSCDCLLGYTKDESGACADDDECKTQKTKCPAASGCKNNVGSFDCHCFQGFTKEDGLCKNVDECDDLLACAKNEKCTDTEGSFTCACQEGLQLVGGICVKTVTCKFSLNFPSLSTTQWAAVRICVELITEPPQL